MPLLTLLLVLSDLLQLTFTVTKHTTVFIIALTQHVMHFVRCSDLTTKTLQWVDTHTNTVMDTVLAAYSSRNIAPSNIAKQLKKLPTVVYKGSASNTQFWAH